MKLLLRMHFKRLWILNVLIAVLYDNGLISNGLCCP